MANQTTDKPYIALQKREREKRELTGIYQASLRSGDYLCTELGVKPGTELFRSCFCRPLEDSAA
jgi:hypothetical protein